MKKSVFVTGVTGAGKSTLCGRLNDMGYKAYDIERISGLFKRVNTETGEIVSNHDNDNLEDVKTGEWICDKEMLRGIIEKEEDEISFYCGSVSNYDEIVSLFDKVFLLRVRPEIMRQRLSSRKKGESGRLKEIQDWIMTWKDWWENDISEKGAVVINADNGMSEVAEEIIEFTKEQE